MEIDFASELLRLRVVGVCSAVICVQPYRIPPTAFPLPGTITLLLLLMLSLNVLSNIQGLNVGRTFQDLFCKITFSDSCGSAGRWPMDRAQRRCFRKQVQDDTCPPAVGGSKNLYIIETWVRFGARLNCLLDAGRYGSSIC